MYCEKCGKEVKNNVNFCPICGHDMKNVKAVNEEEKKKIIKDLSVAIPIYKGLADICNEGIKIQERLNKTYQNKDYGIPIVTLSVIFLKFMAKLLIACVILSIITSPIMGLLTFIFKNNLEMVLTINFIWESVVFILSIVAAIMYTKIKRNNYRKEIKKKEQEAYDYLEAHSCDEIYVLPDGYQKYDAAKFVLDSLVSGKADTLKDAIKMYDRHCQKENAKK